MNAFTDDDLKRLKKEAFDEWDSFTFGHDALNAFVARLEAAEKLIECHPCLIDSSNVYNQWRKAAGK